MLEIRNLTIEYSRKILDNVNIKFKRGTVTVIRGQSGSGKSSLLNILGLIQKPNKACVYELDNERVDFTSDTKKSVFRLNKIGFIFQQNNLLQEFTTLENIYVPNRMLSNNEKAIKDKAKKILDFVGLSEVANNYPADLSGGEEQRVAIARAIINDADIILADEPTAALDPRNSQNILRLFQQLAHELNKIVIIVSHDDVVTDYADSIYDIRERKLVNIFDKHIMSDLIKKPSNIKKKHTFSFIRFYKRKRKKEKGLSNVLIVVTALIAAIATLFINFGDSFNKQQKDFINSISENSLFVINNTLGIDSQTNYEDAYSIPQDILDKIKALPNVQKSYPFYEFPSSNATSKADVVGKVTIKENTNETMVANDNSTSFRVTPLFKEENIDNMLINSLNGSNVRDGVVLSSFIAKKLTDQPINLIGKTIVINCFIPTKMFDSDATKPQGVNGQTKTANLERIKIDGAYYKAITIEKKITGVLNDSYNYQKSEEVHNLIFMDYDEMAKVLDTNKDTSYTTTGNFPEKALSSSALNLYVTSFEDLASVKSKIEEMSPTITVVSKAMDVKKIQSNLEMVKTIMQTVSIILIVIVMLMFGFVYYFRNRSRKKEIGILKALGLTTGDIINLITFEMITVAIKTFILSSIFIIAIMEAGTNLFGLGSVLSVTYESIIFCFILTFFIVIVSGISSIWKTSRIDPIDAIRKNK